MDTACRRFLLALAGLTVYLSMTADAAIPEKTSAIIRRVNREGPFLGLVIPNSFEMSPLLESEHFTPSKRLPYLDFAGRRFRFGKVSGQKVVMVMTGLSMLNAGLSTQLLLSLFDIKAIVHFGIAGNANPDLQIGDVSIPHYWGHTGLWNWQRHGQGPENELAFEAGGDYTRKFGSLNFSDYTLDQNDRAGSSLNSVWYQPEEIFPVTGVPEERQHAFWVPVDDEYFNLASKLESLQLPHCANATLCLPRSCKVVRVERGCSANVLLDNAAYRAFLRSKFDVTAIDMETAAVALVSLEFDTPYIAFRALSDLAGGGSADSNEANDYGPLAAQNAVTVAVHFISLLSRV